MPDTHPGSTCVHYRALLNDDGTMKPVSELRAVFENAGADLSRAVITTCGSGVTAAILNLGLERLGHGNTLSMTAPGPNGACMAT